MPMDDNTKESGKTTHATVEDTSITQMETFITVSSETVKQVEKESTLGPTVKCMTASGIVDSSMVMASGRVSTATPTQGNGDIQKQKATASTPGRMEIVTKASGNIASNTGKEQISSATEMSTLGSIMKGNQKAKGNTHGQMVAFTLENSEEA